MMFVRLEFMLISVGLETNGLL